MGKRKKNMLTGSQIVIETLIEQGVTDVFGYPGGAVLGIYDELYKSKRRIRHILCAHEQGAAHAADGFARVSGKVGVVIATSGPGATNLVTGIATAMLDSVPMVAITGNVPSYQVGKDSFQEINITGVTMPITKHNYFVTDVTELADIIREAFRIAISGRPGPVLIDIPNDIQSAVCEFIPGDKVTPFEAQRVSDADIDAAVSLINASERPYIYIGGGAVGADLSEAVMAFAEKIDAYVGCSFMGLSALPTDYERFLGMQGMHGKYASSMANRECDLIIGVGVRFSDRATGNTEKYACEAKIIQLDADISEINKNVLVDVGLVGDISDSFARILEKCEKKQHPTWRARVNELKAEDKKLADSALSESADKLTPTNIFKIINSKKSPDTVVATDVGQHQMWTAQNISLSHTRSFLSSGGLGTMGYGLGAAIGASVESGKRTLLITGDGSFAMNLTELATAVSYKIPVTIVILNNGALGMVRQWQMLFCDKRYSSTLLNRKTDFVKVAKAFGARAARACTLEEFSIELEKAINYKGPYVIDTKIDIDEFVFPMLPPGGSTDDIIVAKSEDDSK